MLQQLTINNFALIDKVDISFDENLSVITGETGAGKSILLGALNLILGKRADHSILKDTSRKCIVEGVFSIKEYKLQSFFKKHDFDYSDSTILRREINGNGKSRSFINDTPCTLEVLKLLGTRLIDIHSQHQSLQINDSKFQLSLIDSLANNEKLLAEYRSAYKAYKELSAEIARLKQSLAESKSREDYLNFQFQELEELNLQENESEKLGTEQNRFANGEEIVRQLGSVQNLLEENELSVFDQLATINRSLLTIEKFDDSFKELAERINSVKIELQDVSSELYSKANDFEYNAERHQIVEERLAEIHRLKTKHGLTDEEELVALKSKIEEEILSISDSDSRIEELELKRTKQEQTLNQLANSLSNRRKRILSPFENKIQVLLELLGIPNAQLKIEHHLQIAFSEYGKDKFQFLFSANKGIAPQLISKTASGGEVSRLMLSIKSVLADNTDLPTILFDEIDTGVSGEIAEKIGGILSGMGDKRQVIAITHLPQLAAKGKQHYFVYKEVISDKSITQIKRLSEEDRVKEVAKMLSGAKLTDAAINNAKELLSL